MVIGGGRSSSRSPSACTTACTDSQGTAVRSAHPSARSTSTRWLANADELALSSAADIVILHDPQTAGLAAAVRATGATVIWRCHVGLDSANDHAREAWDFLRGYVLTADAFVFSRAGFAWEGLPRDRISVIHPSIDAFSPKNAEQGREQSLAILPAAGILAHDATDDPTFTRSDGSHRARGSTRRDPRGATARTRDRGRDRRCHAGTTSRTRSACSLASPATSRDEACASAAGGPVDRRPWPTTPRARQCWQGCGPPGTSCPTRSARACI